MKRKQMIAVMLLLAALTGCAQQEQKKAEKTEIEKIETEKIETGTEEEGGSGVNAGAEAGANAAAANESDADADVAANEGRDADTVRSDSASDAEIETDMQAEEETTYLGFGDAATMDFDAGGRNVPIYCVDTQEKKVALSFDAAWGNEDTKQILSILKEHDIHVTFFMTGGWVESYPDDVKAILDAGHDLGNHSENHKNMSELSDEEKTEELMAVHRKVEEITGYDMFLFRPPYGDYDDAVIDVAKDCGYYAIQWDVDSLDWKNEGLDNIIDTVINHKNLGNGSIILCHNGAEYTAEALDTLITSLEEQGYEIVPISELIYREDFHMNFEGRQIAN